MASPRIHFPETLPTATKFSGQSNLHESVQLIRAFKETTWLSRPFIAKTSNLAPVWGRRRMDGSWGLVALALIASRQGDIQPFHDRASMELWRECGFTEKPSYSTTHARLTELEKASDYIVETINTMVRHYRRHDSRIGRHIRVDGTEAETHSRFIHDCREDEYCAFRDGESETATEPTEAPVVRRASTGVVQERRHKFDAGEEDEVGDEEVESVEPLVEPQRVEGERRTAADIRGARIRRQLSNRPLHRVRTSKHSWLTHDGTAGFRTYTLPNGDKVSWHGYYHQRATDDFTGLNLTTQVFSASIVEANQYESVLKAVIKAMNPPARVPADGERFFKEAEHGKRAKRIATPEALMADRGFTYPFIFERNSRLDIATVGPLRKVGGSISPKDSSVVDDDGVIKCPTCGGPTTFSEFRTADDENPRVYVKCAGGGAPGSTCATARKSVSCAEDWRFILPLWRDDLKYQALRYRFEQERTHQMARARNRVSGKDPLLRPKRLGRDWQQTLAHLSDLLDWFRAGIKHGWLASSRAAWRGYPDKVVDGIRSRRKKLWQAAEERVKNILAGREAAGLTHEPVEPEDPPPQ